MRLSRALRARKKTGARGVARSEEGTLEKRGSKNLRRDARVVLGLELRRLAQPRPISLEINRLGLLSQAKGRAVYASTPCAASPSGLPFRSRFGPARGLKRQESAFC